MLRDVGFLLITNDDGVDSPALIPLVRELSKLREVRVVVPAEERSWISKAISRWNDVRVEKVERAGFEIWAIHGGFPADCTNLGVHSLFDERPDMVVSGVNMGLNSGLGFFLSSGTVGAAMEGWIAGLPAMAFSVGIADNDREWKEAAKTDSGSELWERAARLSTDVVRIVLEVGYPEQVDLINVNFPVEADLMTPRVITDLAVVGYGRLFEHTGDGIYRHNFDGALHERAPLDGTDLSVLRDGRVSITPVRLAHTTKLPAGFRHRLERSVG
jgi:5'-nucleotidase